MDLKVKPQKILIELDVQTSCDGDGKHFTTTLSHPDLLGHLYLRSSSGALAQVQLDSLDKAKIPIPPTDPINIIVDGVNKILTSAGELRDMLKNE